MKYNETAPLWAQDMRKPLSPDFEANAAAGKAKTLASKVTSSQDVESLVRNQTALDSFLRDSGGKYGFDYEPVPWGEFAEAATGLSADKFPTQDAYWDYYKNYYAPQQRRAELQKQGGSLALTGVGRGIISTSWRLEAARHGNDLRILHERLIEARQSGDDTSDLLERIAEIEAMSAEVMGRLALLDNSIGEGFGQSLGDLVHMFNRYKGVIATTAATGTAAGMVMGAPVGGIGAIPGALGGFGIGLSTGIAGASMDYTQELEAGLAYLEQLPQAAMLGFNDEEMANVIRNIRIASTFAGLAEGGSDLFFMGLGGIGVKALAKPLLKTSVGTAVKTAGGSIGGQIVKGVAANAAFEGITEVAQEAAMIAAERASWREAGYGNPISSEEARAQMLEAGKVGAAVGGIFGGFGGSFNAFAITVNKQAQIQQAARIPEILGEFSAAIERAKADTDGNAQALNQVVERMVPDKAVYLDGSALNTFLSDPKNRATAGVFYDRFVNDENLGGLQNAMETGDTFEINLRDYMGLQESGALPKADLSRLGRFVEENAKFDVDQMTFAQAKAAEQDLPNVVAAELKELNKKIGQVYKLPVEAERKLKGDIKQLLANGGYKANTADVNALTSILKAFGETFARFDDTAMSVEEYLNKAIKFTDEGMSVSGDVLAQINPYFEAETKLAEEAAAWGQTVDTFNAGLLSRSGSLISVLSQTPLIFQLIGAKNLPVTTRQGVLKKVIKGKHELDAELIKQVPQALADPIMIIKSKGVNAESDITLMLDLKDEYGATVVVPVMLNDTTHGYEMNFLPSIYVKNNEKTKNPDNQWFVNQIKNGDVIYANHKKVTEWNRIARRQLPGWNSIPNKHTILTEADLVKLKNQNPTLYQTATLADEFSDARYFAAVEAGDMEAAQRVVDYNAAKKGYISQSDYRMNHRAPSSKDEDVSVSLANVKESGLVPDDYWTTPQYYQYESVDYQSFYAVKAAIDKHAQGTNKRPVSIWMYRAVPKNVKESEFRNGDWISPSREYAQREGGGIAGGYKIISQRVKLSDVWWDANSINEFGFDDGKDYAYKDTKNNRKLTDVVTRDYDGNIVPPSKRFNPRAFEPFYQSAEANRLGSTTILGNGQYLVQLFKGGNVDTVLHELAHVFALETERLAASNETMSAIYDDLLEYTGATRETGLQTEHHEKIAVAFEAYMMKGKAPDSRLAQAFMRLKNMMLQIYNSLRVLPDIELTPEVTEVFDFWLAVDQTEKMQAVDDGIFSDIYTDMVDEQGNLAGTDIPVSPANQKILYRSQARLQRQADRMKEMAGVGKTFTEYKEEAAKTQQLTRLKTLRDKVVKQGIKLDGESVQYTQAIADIERRMGAKVFRKDGLSPADMNYTDMDSLMEALLEASRYDELLAAKAREFYHISFLSAQDLADVRLAPEYSELLEARQKVIKDSLKELLGFSSGDATRLYKQAARELYRVVRDTPGMTALRQLHDNLKFLQQGQKTIDRSVNDLIDAVRLHENELAALEAEQSDVKADAQIQALQEKHAARVSELKAKHEANVQKLRERLDRSIQAQNQRMANYKERVRAGRQRVKVNANIKRLNRNLKNKDIEIVTRELLKDILYVYGYRANKSTWFNEKKANLEEWIAGVSQPGADFEPVIGLPEYQGVRDFIARGEKQTPGKLTLDQADALWAAVSNMAAIGKSFTDFGRILETDRLGAARANVLASIDEHALHHYTEAELKDRKETGGRIGKMARGALQEVRTMQSLAFSMDGDKYGAIMEHVITPLSNAADRAFKMTQEADAAIKALFEPLKESRLNEKIMVELESGPRFLTRSQIISALLNMGNEHNYQALLGDSTNHFTENDLVTMVGKLTPTEIRFAQSLWNYIDMYFPMLSDMYAKEGLPVTKVKAAPLTVTASDGSSVELAGGYYPVVRDKHFARFGAADDPEAVTAFLRANYERVTPQNSHAKERTGQTGAPLVLALDVIPQHINAVITDLAYRPVVKDVFRILNTPAIKTAIHETRGLEAYNVFMRTIKDTLLSSGQNMGNLNAILRHARNNYTIFVYGFKLSVMMGQMLGLGPTLHEVGGRNMLQAMQAIMSDPVGSMQFIQEHSSYMPTRRQTFDMNMNDIVSGLNTPGTASAKFKDAQRKIAGVSMFGVGYMDYIVSGITWWAAYNKEMGASGDQTKAVNYADSTVIRSQSGGRMIDRPELMRGNEFVKLFTFAYTAFNGMLNQEINAVARAMRGQGGIPSIVLNITPAIIIIMVIPQFLDGLIRGMLDFSLLDKDDEDRWYEYVKQNMASAIFSPMPFVRDVASAMEYSSINLPGFPKMMQETGRLVNNILDGDMGKKEMRQAVRLAAMTLGLPFDGFEKLALNPLYWHLNWLQEGAPVFNYSSPIKFTD